WTFSPVGQRRLQNLASLFTPSNVIQKLMPSLQACHEEDPSGNEPRGERSAAFQRVTEVEPPATRMRSPLNATAVGAAIPAVSVCRMAPLEGPTTVTEPFPLLGTQMFDPSKAGYWGPKPTVTDWRIAPEALSLTSVPGDTKPSGRKGEGTLAGGEVSVTQTLLPSKMAPKTAPKPVVTVVTVHGTVAPGVTIETEAPFVVQTCDPSNVIPNPPAPPRVATVVTAPAGCAGSIAYILGSDTELTSTRPIAETTPVAPVAAVQVSRNLPSLARI